MPAASYVEGTLWPTFLQLQAVLQEHFEAVTKRVIAQAIGADGSHVEVCDGTVLDASSHHI